MTIGLDPTEILPRSHQQALDEAAVVLADMFFEDLDMLHEDANFAQLTMSVFLPAKYMFRYDLGFARRFFACLMTVIWKLKAPGAQRLACVAEELALNAIIQEAEVLLQADGVDADFDSFYDCAFEDSDFELLFDPEVDGIEESNNELGLGIANLRFKDWFKPFRDEDPVHPFAAD